MKNRLTSRLGLVATAFLLATAITATADTAALTKAKVIRIKGSARFTTGTGSWQPLKVGDVLTSGTVIQSAADSRVDLVLGDPKATASSSKVGLPFASATPGGGGGGAGSSKVDQNFLRLMENTVLSVDKLAATDTGADIVTDTQLDLRSGRIFGTVKKLSAGSRYEVKIPNGVAGVRGTIYMLSALGDCMVFEGSMAEALENSAGAIDRHVINTNQKFDPRTGKITDLSSQDQRELIMNTGESKQVQQGSSLFGPTPVRSAEDDYLSPTQGYNP
jgi:hypothetical protein